MSNSRPATLPATMMIVRELNSTASELLVVVSCVVWVVVGTVGITVGVSSQPGATGRINVGDNH